MRIHVAGGSVVRWWLVAGRLGLQRLLDLAELTLGGLEPIRERTHERVELPDLAILKRQLDLELDELLAWIFHRATIMPWLQSSNGDGLR